jgi:hypothetical protein
MFQSCQGSMGTTAPGGHSKVLKVSSFEQIHQIVLRRMERLLIDWGMGSQKLSKCFQKGLRIKELNENDIN